MERRKHPQARHDAPSRVTWSLSPSAEPSQRAEVRPVKRPLSHLEGLALVPQLAELGVHEVTLRTGALPLQLDWLELVRALRDHGIACSMLAQGRGFHAECASAAARAGLCNVGIALDGLEHVHDRLHAKRGVFRTALEALTNLRAAGVPVSVHTEVCQDGVHDLLPLLEKVVAHGVHGWHIARMVHAPAPGDDAPSLLMEDDLLSLVPLLDELERRCEQAGVRLSLGPSLDFVAHEASFCGALPRQSGFLRTGMVIGADGLVMLESSWRSEPVVLGSLRECTLPSLWERGAQGAARDDVA